jgi:hypothetical protein
MNRREEGPNLTRAERAMLQQIMDMNEQIVNTNQAIAGRLLGSIGRQADTSRFVLFGNPNPSGTSRNNQTIHSFVPMSNNEEENHAVSALLSLLMATPASPGPMPPTQSDIERSITITTYGDLSEEIRNSQTTCPITHENFSDNTEVALFNRCEHVFNRTAATRWLQSNSTCPVCRDNIRQTQPQNNNLNNQNNDANNYFRHYRNFQPNLDSLHRPANTH